jgi:hypothetical protein
MENLDENKEYGDINDLFAFQDEGGDISQIEALEVSSKPDAEVEDALDGLDVVEEKPKAKSKSKAKQKVIVDEDEDLEHVPVDLSSLPEDEKEEEEDEILKGLDGIEDKKARDTYAIQNLKKLSAEIKQLRPVAEKLKDLESERDQLKEQLEETRRNSSANDRELLKHPEVQVFVDKAMKALDDTSLLLPTEEDSKLFERKSEEYTKRYMDATRRDISNEERRKELASLREELHDTYGSTYGNDVFEFARKAAGYSEQIGKKYEELKERTVVQSRGLGHDKWVQRRNELFERIDEATLVNDEDIDLDPDSPEAIISSLVSSSTAWSKRYEGVKNEVAELLNGPKEFSDAQIAKMKATGTDVENAIKQRRKSVEDHNKKLVARVAHALMLLPMVPDLRKKAKQYDNKEKDLGALSKVGKRSAPKVIEEEDEYPDINALLLGKK